MAKRPLVLTIVVLGTLLLSGNVASLYLDWLWFTEINQVSVFAKTLKTQLLMGLVAGSLFFAILYGNLARAHAFRSRSPIRELNDWIDTPIGPLQPMLGQVILIASGVIAFFVGVNAAFRWREMLLFLNPAPFGQTDSVFGLDLGFYVFRLPFLASAQSWLTAALAVAALASTVVYALHRGIAMTPQGLIIDRIPRRHLLILGGFFLAAKGWGYRLESYELLFTTRGVVTGAVFADVNVRIPALTILAVAGVIGGILVAASAFLRGYKIPIAVAAILFGGSILGGSILPDMLHRFKVQPNEIVMESPFIQENIKMTRYAFGLTNIEEKVFPAEEDLTARDLAENDLTIKNVRLWDHKPLLATYRQLQQIRTYYDFVGVDNDRYVVDGEYRQVMITPRELSYQNLPGGTNWINERLSYTHGYGAILGPVNRISPEGLPEFLIKDIPGTSTSDIQVTRPEIYYGENSNAYVFVNTKALEFDYPVGDRNEYSNYAGQGGIPVNSFFRKVLFSIHYGDLKILLSNDIQPESRIMIRRNISERVRALAPFLHLDRDPYLVITAEGRLVWIVDGFTVSDHIPYSLRVRGLGNYIRNSVKAVVDAYNGSVRLYVNDPEDPIIQSYARIFPDLFERYDQMPEDIRAHLRFPQDLFTIQSQLYATYHIQDPQIFYNKEDLWNIPQRDGQNIDPYYTVMRLPGEAREEFILMIPYTPAKRDNMAAWLAARSDAPNYGKLVVYLFPKQKLVFGPRQIDARIDQDSAISQQLTLWSQRGSQVIRGSLLVIPIKNSLLYVQPLYLAASAGSLPELRRVIVAYGNQISMEPNLESALSAIFGGRPSASPATATGATTRDAGAPKSTRDEIAKSALKHFEKAREFLKEGNWASYGVELDRTEKLLRELSETQTK